MKKFFVFFIFNFLLLHPVIGQINIEWQKCYGGSANDNGIQSIIQTFDGGYAFVASTTSLDGDVTGFHQNSFYRPDTWVVKIDSVGSIEWQKCLGGTDYENPNSIIQCADSGFAILSYTNSEDGDVDSVAFNSTWLVKLSPLGVIEWQNGYDIGFPQNVPSRILQSTPDRGFVLIGWSLNISEDIVLLKLDSIGNISWQQNMGGTRTETPHTVLTCADGGYFILGSTNSNDGDVTGWHADSIWNIDDWEWDYTDDFWAVKVDSVGNIEWQKCYGGGNGELAVSAVKTTDGGYILCGHTASYNGDMTDNFASPGAQCWVVKIDSTGNIQWNRRVSISFGFEIIQLNDKSYRIFGSWGNKLAIAKLDSLGNSKWISFLGGSSNFNYGFCGVQNADGAFLIGGGVGPGNISGHHGGIDNWLVKFNENTNIITGNIFLDVNSNSVKDNGETGIHNKLITETFTGKSAFSDYTGNYLISVSDTGNFQINSPSINYYTANPLNYNINFASLLQVDSINDFAFQPTSIVNDLCINITPVGMFRAGFDASYVMNYSNLGNSTLNPTIVFYPDTNISFVSSVPNYSSAYPDSVVWNLGSLNPLQNGQISVSVNVNTGLPIGTTLSSGAIIEPIVGDINPTCNYSYWEVNITGSMDPNDILVNHDSLTLNEVISGQYLEYIIRFQNTGNDTAFTVNILNPIDTNLLNIGSLEFLNSSHQVSCSWNNYMRTMEFRFENILLPDSNVNEPLSHGFVRYKIQPKTVLSVGDSISNHAGIFFDFNDPVVTNIAKTYIYLPTALNELYENAVSIYPNPVKNDLSIELKESTGQKFIIDIHNIYGQKVMNLFDGEVNSVFWKRKFDVSGLANGIYFLTLKGNGTVVKKIIKL